MLIYIYLYIASTVCNRCTQASARMLLSASRWVEFVSAVSLSINVLFFWNNVFNLCMFVLLHVVINYVCKIGKLRQNNLVQTFMHHLL